MRTFQIQGMDCADCARTIERGVARLYGVEQCRLSYATARLQVAGSVSDAAVAAEVRALGYEMAPSQKPIRSPQVGWRSWLAASQRNRLLLLATLLVLPALVFQELLPMLGVRLSLFSLMAAAAALLAGYPVARRAWQAVTRQHVITIDLLMTIAALGALLIGAYAEAGVVMVLFRIGESLEGYTMERTRAAVGSLMDTVPPTATVLRPCVDCTAHRGRPQPSGPEQGQPYLNGPCPFCGIEEQSVAVEDLHLGETIVVKPGARIPIDGQVQAGHSTVNQAPITGESVPVTVAPGAQLFAGTINGDGALEIEVTRLAEDTTLSRIIAMVEEAQEQRAPVQRFIDRFAARYTPVVVVAAALVALLPPLLWGAPFLSGETGDQGWLYRGLALLVVACPCALVISTPVSLISAIRSAAAAGVLVKGGAYLEALSRITAIAFDKTGTLTTGQPKVTAVRALQCAGDDLGRCLPCTDLLALATAVEQRSQHPLARAVMRAAADQGLHDQFGPARQVTNLPGLGVTGLVAGRRVLVASHAHFDAAIPHDVDHCAAAHHAARQGQSSLLVRADDDYMGYITVADSVREGSRAALADLRRAGLRHLIMLTGDQIGPAQAVADDLGITDLKAELLPDQKLQAVRELMAQHRAVAMVGDGINDTPALAASTVGIAMGAAAGGTDQALETADVVLMGTELNRLPYLFRLSRATMQTVRANVFFSVGIKALFLLLIVAGVGSMWLAVLADVGASLLVTLNGMRLLRWQP